MNRIFPLPFVAFALAVPCVARAQEPPMTHPRSTFLAARLEAKNVVPPSVSSGSGTGVFVFLAKGREATVSYQLSYATLLSPEVRSILLRNFGAGKEGRVVHVVCGEGAKSCPAGTDGTLRGSWSATSTKKALVSTFRSLCLPQSPGPERSGCS